MLSTIWTKRLFGFVGFIVANSLLFSPSVSIAVSAPNISIVKISPEIWNLSNDQLLIKGHLDAPGKWRVDLLNLCTGESAISQTGEKTEAGDFEVNLNSTATEEIVSGPFQVVLTPSIGAKLGTAKKQFLKIVDKKLAATRQEDLCENASRLVSQNSVTGQIAAINHLAKQNELETSSAVLFSYSSEETSIAAFATNYGAASGQVVLATNELKLSKSALNEIQRRQITKVKIIGTKEMISKEVVTSLKSIGIKTRRFDAADVFTLAPLVWDTYSGEPFSSAVLADYSATSTEVLQALAFANAQKVPLLPVTNTRTKISRDLLGVLGISTGTAVVNAVSLSDISLAKFANFTRVYVADNKELSIALSQKLTEQPHTLLVRDKNSAVSNLDLVATSNPVSIWPAEKTISDFDTAYISTRPFVQKIYATDYSSTLSDSRLAAYAREIYKRDAPKPLAELPMPEIEDLTAPANFAFSGSGWGHGIGMSQWGAYAMANAGKTAAEILTYYFTGTEIGPAIDDADVWVSLQNRIRSLTLRLREVNGDIGTWRLTADDGTSIDLAANETASFTFDADAITVSVTTSKDQSLGPTGKVIATWSGTRFDKDLGDTASAIQVIGPNETTTSGRLYRFGNLRIKAAESTETYVSGMQVTNRVSLHDEYIYGIGEVSNSWPTESLAAQAIAARSFAYNRAYNADGTLNSRMGACDCMVYDDIRDQNYVGWSKLNSSGGDRWKAAVDGSNIDATHSNFVLYNGKVVQTFFAAATGGYTQNNEDVWGGTPRPYYRAVEDPWSLMPEPAISVSVWSPRIRSQETLAAAFGLTDVAYLDLSDRYVSGGIRTAVAYSTTGASATISGEKFRSRVQSVDGDSLQSTWIWKALVSFSETAAPNFSKSVLSERSLGFAKIPGATSTSLVLVQNNSVSSETLAIAASYAGIKKSALLVTKVNNDAERITQYITEKAITDVTVIGAIDSNIIAAIQGLGKNISTITGNSVFELSNNVAQNLDVTTGKKYVLANLNNPSQIAIATSLAVRTKRALLLTGNGLMNLETAQFLVGIEEPDVIVVGTTDDISNAAMASVENAKRLDTSDLGEASLNSLYQNQDTTRGLVVMGDETPVWKSLLLAATGLPVILDQDSIRARAIKWLRRQPLSTVVVSLGAAELFVTKVRRS